MYDLEPTEFYLSQNYPNPFSEKTVIKYCVAYKSRVKLEVFNPECVLLNILLDEEKETGSYETTWYAERMPSGVYFYQLRAGPYIKTKKMLLLK